jgi:N6-adenosine-specific RNA methylase IME4
MADFFINGKGYSITTIDPDILQRSLTLCAEVLPVDRKFDVILLDPPWSYTECNKPGLEGKIKYPTMSLQKLAEMPIKRMCKRDAAVFCWTTSPKMSDAVILLNNWGLKYKTIFRVWRKVTKAGNPVCGMGHWTRGVYEYLLVATVGSPLKYRTGLGGLQEICARLGKHSSKPPQFRDAIRDFLDVPDRLELFARERSEGFWSWGLEIENFLQPPI